MENYVENMNLIFSCQNSNCKQWSCDGRPCFSDEEASTHSEIQPALKFTML